MSDSSHQNLMFDGSELNRQTLAHFGINSNDCTFETLTQCALHLAAEKPNTQVRRWHDAIIQRIVKPGDSLIDLGCGDGELLARLAYTSNCWIQGVEKDESLVNLCIERGIPVCHGELLDILTILPDKNYDWAILEDTIQTLERPLDALQQMLRIARRSIITFPNFAHWSVRFTFSLGGRMPVTKSLPYKWYDTPNIHLCSIEDFMDCIRDFNLNILEAWALVEGNVVKFNTAEGHNITAEQIMFVVEK